MCTEFRILLHIFAVTQSNSGVLGKNKLLVLMGDLHTEMTFMTCLGMPETYYIHSSTTDKIKFDRE